MKMQSHMVVMDLKRCIQLLGGEQIKNSEYDYGAIKLAGAPGNDTGWFG